MGNAKTKEVLLKPNELNEFHNMTSLSTEILIKLHEHYRRFSSINTDDGVIDYKEFCTLINKFNTNLAKRIFDAIDANKDGYINFREFVKFLSCFNTGTLEDQINLSFSILRNPVTKKIDCDCIKNLLKEAIHNDSFRKYFNEDVLDNIVYETYKKLTGDPKIDVDLQLYNKMIRENPDLLSWFKVDLQNLKRAKLQQKDKKNTACFG
jgi:Ca2+-binding EF-hand superfamily protein